eukprot:m.271712 g.271712  ORF g.271712 m.271712 type:complete len:4223 (+) comp15683_c19_seq1:207-12875(+)
MAGSKPIWASDSFIAQFGDKYVAGSGLEAGHMANSISFLRYFYTRLFKSAEQDGFEQEAYPLLKEAEYKALKQVLECLEQCHELTASQNPEKPAPLVQEHIKSVKELQVGEFMFVPGGWIGLRSANAVMHIIERTGAAMYAFITCNASSGLDYHPSMPVLEKIKYKTCIKVDQVAQDKITDPVFWTILFGQWMQEPSEYSREEVLYDVMLPWLAGKLLPSALLATKSDPRSTWRTPCRSGTGYYKNVTEAVQYVLRAKGWNTDQLKQLSYAFRREVLNKIREDLYVLADPEGALADGFALGLQPAPSPDGPGMLQPQVARQLMSGNLVNNAGNFVDAKTLQNKTIGLLFSGGWCGPCRAFKPLLELAQRKVRARQQEFEVVFCSADKTKQEFDEYFGSMPADWLAVPFEAQDPRRKLAETFDVKGIPFLVIIGPGGRIYTLKGVEAIRDDPEAAGFPWSPAAVAAARAARGPDPLAHHETMLIRWACESVTNKALKEQQQERFPLSNLRELQTHVERITDLVNTLPDGHVFHDTEKLVSVIQPTLSAEHNVPFVGLDRLELLHDQSSVDHYAGDTLSPTVPDPIDFLGLPVLVTTIDEADHALSATLRVVNKLLDRAQDTSTTSRLVLQYNVIATIGELFTKVIPMPKYVYSAQEQAIHDDDIWSSALQGRQQIQLLTSLYQLALTYGQVWQAVDVVPRESACERTVVAACIFAVFDAVLRRPAIDIPSVLSVMLMDAGGYSLSTTLCQKNVSLLSIAERLELHTPALAEARDGALEYLTKMDGLRNEIFKFRQPDKIEVKKYGSTLLFLRELLQRLGYPLIPTDRPRPPPEIEALAEWLCGENTQLAKDHPEWAMARDMCVFFKFLATMDTREAELMQHRREKQQFLWWKLSFEEGGRRGWWGQLRAKPFSWEIVNFRGMDMDTADIEVVGFGNRRLKFGSGPVVQSPSNIEKLLHIDHPSEDDILHSTSLPTFNNTLSREESEQLMSYISVDYVRIPLVLGFFASRDRVTYLFNKQLQAMVRAIMFESGAWVSSSSRRPVLEVPLRKTAQQLEAERLRRRMDARAVTQEEELGTPRGLLYNELLYSPESCLEPFMIMLKATKPLHGSSVYSNDASFLLYILELAIDVEAYLKVIKADLEKGAVTKPFTSKEDAVAGIGKWLDELRGFCRDNFAKVLRAWEQETETKNDIITSCVVMSYKALLYANMNQNSITEEEAVGFLSGFLYVRNWHGFGLGLHASQMNDLEDDVQMTSEERILRFLQAYGVDTSRVKPKELQQYMKGKPLFLHVGGQTVRAPMLMPEDATTVALPPCDVPEHRLFIAHAALRRSLCTYVDRVQRAGQVDALFRRILRIALRVKNFQDGSWQRVGPGRFNSTESDLKVDLQTGEVLWRNNDLQPVPDSIAQFTDYQALFQDASMHCGIVAKQSHRYWVHLVGTEFDAIQWDEPSVTDQGLNCPTQPPASEGDGAPGAVTPEFEANVRQLVALGFPFDRVVDALKATNNDVTTAASMLAAGRAPTIPSRMREQSASVKGITFNENCVFGGITWNRAMDMYDEKPHCGLSEEAEFWIADTLKPIIFANFPPEPEDKRLPYKLLLPATPYKEEDRIVRLLGCAFPDKSHATWKEIVVYKDRKLVHMYNLVSHGRRMFRTLVYTSHHGLCLASLSPNLDPNARPLPAFACKQAGDMRRTRGNEPSLILQRRNVKLAGHEVFIPKRLLLGLIPSSLLESHQFFQGEDGTIRGSPASEADDDWLHFDIEVTLEEDPTRGIVGKVVRLDGTGCHTQIATDESHVEGENLLVRQTSIAQPSVQTIEYNPQHVEGLVAIGISELAAKLALRTCKHNPEAAAEWLFDPSNKAAIDAELAMDTDASVEVVEQLVEMGFPEIAAKRAIALDGTLEGAIMWLSDDANVAECARLEEQAGGSVEAAGDGAPSTVLRQASSSELLRLSTSDVADVPEPVRQGTPTHCLLNLLDAEPGSFLYRLGELVVRVEDFSHVLVWGSIPSPDDPTSTVEVDVIEMPRLKLRLKPRVVGSSIRLGLLDHPGWFVSDVLSETVLDSEAATCTSAADESALDTSTDDVGVASTKQKSKSQLANLLEGLEHSLLLENGAGGYMVLMPNHDVHRPRVSKEPFSAQLVFDRSSLGWLTTMDTRYYLYPVHQSQLYLSCSTLASTLYLLLVRLLTRWYSASFQLADAVCTDTSFDGEEQWIFDQFARTVVDQHPEAHACRLKLVLAIMYSDNTPKWDVHVDADGYLRKLQGVRAQCRLTRVQELDALFMCKQMTPVLKNRLVLLQKALGKKPGQRHFGGGAAEADPDQVVTIKGAPLRWGGRPWAKLMSTGLDFVTRSGSQLTRVQFKHPGSTPHQLSTDEVTSMIWDCSMVLDEESGSSRQLGFLFLYLTLCGNITCKYESSVVNRSLGELLTRIFQLKLARWGKEAVGDGEVEYVMSKQMAVLACVLHNPDYSWPQVPSDSTSRGLLQRGVNLYTQEGRMTEVKMWMDMLDAVFRSCMTDPLKTLQTSLQIDEFAKIRSNPLSVSIDIGGGYVLESNALPLSLSNCSMQTRSLVPMNFAATESGGVNLRLTSTDIEQFGSTPLASLISDELVKYHNASDAAGTELPFSLDEHPAAANSVAQELLARLREDVQTFAASHNSAKQPSISVVERETLAPGGNVDMAAVRSAVEGLSALREALSSVLAKDMGYALGAFSEIDRRANHINVQAGDDELAQRTFQMKRFCGRVSAITAEFVLSTLVSTQALEDMASANPFLTNGSSLLLLAASAALHVSRASQVKGVIASTIGLVSLLETLPSCPPGKLGETLQRVQQDQMLLAKLLCAKRHYFTKSAGGPKASDAQGSDKGPTLWYDPRYLLGEFMFEILLRKRQVEIVNEMVASAKAHSSKVQQMIMGAGKTTVVGPMLSMILADGDNVVVQIMPTALLEQTRNVLRSRFSAVLTKKVFTLNFDRSIEDLEMVGKLHAKIQAARDNRDIICAPPEAVKSLMLKFVEELERLESFNLDSLTPNESLRNNREVLRLRDQLENRSLVADSVCSLLKMIHSSGVLIMDEVDVILNPLKSELNFPIGPTTSMPGYRWDLPIHIIDAIFFRTTNIMCEQLDQAVLENDLGLVPQTVVDQLKATLDKGIAQSVMQREPHVVLLSPGYYWSEMRKVVAEWCYLWLLQTWTRSSVTIPGQNVVEYLMEGTSSSDKTLTHVRESMNPEAVRLLNLASDWTRKLLPHCLSKIDRVGFGLLRGHDLTNLDPRAPLSRRLMAVPFVGKDVPSPTSEFAHPDVLVGLTIFAYRYEGLRLSDLKRLVAQLKQDLSRQVGPRDKRPASRLFNSWLEAVRPSLTDAQSLELLDTMLPLPLFQPSNPRQMKQLHSLISKLPHVCYYYLRQHVFPSTMRSQAIKLSASGVDLGSSILFGRARLGFSGTPNNLMPADLGRCEYEPGSDGKIIHVLTSPEVTSATVKVDWTAKSLLQDIATAQPPVQALIDTGALITGFTNEEAARYLMEYLPAEFEGVVFLDRQDRQMILLRSSGRFLPLSQCGVPPNKRFTFYDQIHTTGMDIKQAPNARAILTIGKDMTFRDYAQGAFRMRGIGQGQTIELFVISEVNELLKQDLTVQTGKPEIDIPSWLLINSMNATSLQYCKLGLQELYNAWRKRALSSLQQEVEEGLASPSTSRMRRFMGATEQHRWLRQCVDRFREPIIFPIPDTVPEVQPFGDKLRALQADNSHFTTTEEEVARVDSIIHRVEQVSALHIDKTEGGLDSEVVHENEAEAEEEAEEEAEQEEEKMSAYTRDDEQHNPWKVSLLSQIPSLKLGGDEPFYAFRDFHVSESQPKLMFPEDLLLTDNFFRPRWIGVGDRRLKNVSLVMEWVPNASADVIKAEITRQFLLLTQSGIAPNVAAQQALQRAMEVLQEEAAANQQQAGKPLARYFVALSLAEGETIRRIIHSSQSILKMAAIKLHTIEGLQLDSTHLMSKLPEAARDATPLERAIVSLRFVNNEMFFSDKEVSMLLEAFTHSTVEDRRLFFEHCLRLRRRERNQWGDTPLAKVLTPESAWHLLSARGKLDQFNAALKGKTSLDLHSLLLRTDADNDGKLTYPELQRCLESLQLGFSPRHISEILSVCGMDESGCFEIESLGSVLYFQPVVEQVTTAAKDEDAVWQCQNCTFVNPVANKTCAMCELGWTGQRECPADKWTCPGCTFFNPKNLFYCDVCGVVREDLASVRF